MNPNQVIEKERPIIDSICDKYHYDSNIRHLLMIIIPAFIIKYGFPKEKQILKTFEEIQIVPSNEENKMIKAFYSSIPRRVGDEIKTRKVMVIQNYKDIPLIELLDNLVHEFNHAVNSSVNEVRVSKKYVYLRTGLTFRLYDKETLKFVKKQDSYILEEIINTKQTSDIINIMKGFDSSSFDTDTTVYAINSETSSKYQSNSYYLQSAICKEMLENRTFISTLESLRMSGEVYDIQHWFDTITGEDGSYKTLNELLVDIFNLEVKLVSQKMFRNFTINKIREESRQILRIIDKFNQNVNFR